MQTLDAGRGRSDRRAHGEDMQDLLGWILVRDTFC